jgi:transposase
VCLSIDEKTSTQARSANPRHPAPPGRAVRQQFEYIRHGTVSIIATTDIDTGQVPTEPIERNDSAAFAAFPDTLDAAINPDQEIYPVLDNSSIHTAKHTKAWFRAHPRWHVHFTPQHALWLNMIENWFSTPANRAIRPDDFPDRNNPTSKTEAFTILHQDSAALPVTYDATPLKTARPPTNQSDTAPGAPPIRVAGRTKRYQARIDSRGPCARAVEVPRR